MNRRKALKKTGLFASATVLAPSMLSLLQACNTETRLNWKPLFFTEVEAKTISALIDKILPKTETVGGLDVKADIFIDKVIAKTYDEGGQENIRAQIKEFNDSCEKAQGGIFINLNEEAKTAALQHEEKTSGKFNRGVWGKTVGEQEPIGFYRSMKSMAIWAYFTSEEMGENVLSYDPIPGVYEPCKPVSEVGNRWSL